MKECARGCCWTPFSCSSKRTCPCHWLDAPRNEPRTSDARTYRNPTQDQALRNIEKESRYRGRRTQ